jgi:hypothetical protein
MSKKLLMAAVFITWLAACTPGNNNPVLTLLPGLVTDNPDATATATPFQPEGGGVMDITPTSQPSALLLQRRWSASHSLLHLR